MENRELLGEIVLTSISNKPAICRVCSYDRFSRKYRCLRLFGGRKQILRKKEFIVQFVEVLKKYNKYVKDKNV